MSRVRRGALRTTLPAILGLAAGVGAGCDRPASEPAPPIRDESLPASGVAAADTQVVRDTLGNEFLVITTGRSRIRRVVPRAGSGDPGDVTRMDPADAHEARSAARPPWYVIDVRDARAYVGEGHLPGAALAPAEVLEANLDDLHIRTDQVVLVYGDDSTRAEDAARLLASYGFPDVRVVAGGYPAWKRAGLPVEPGR